MALTRSALASRPSASAAHWIVAAAISFPSATATFPVYSAPIPMAAETLMMDIYINIFACVCVCESKCVKKVVS